MSPVTPIRRIAAAAGLCAATLAVAACAHAGRGATTVSTSASTAASTVPVDTARTYVVAPSDSLAGEYLTTVGGCNDCHSQGWDASMGKLAAADRLTGNPIGYRGPWGTTYAPNLRGFSQRITEDRWVDVLRTAAHGQGKPPMPWMNTMQMADRDLRAMYRYIHSLGPKGDRMPRNVPPGTEPTTPYINFMPVTPAGAMTAP